MLILRQILRRRQLGLADLLSHHPKSPNLRRLVMVEQLLFSRVYEAPRLCGVQEPRFRSPILPQAHVSRPFSSHGTPFLSLLKLSQASSSLTVRASAFTSLFSQRTHLADPQPGFIASSPSPPPSLLASEILWS